MGRNEAGLLRAVDAAEMPLTVRAEDLHLPEQRVSSCRNGASEHVSFRSRPDVAHDCLVAESTIVVGGGPDPLIAPPRIVQDLERDLVVAANAFARRVPLP